MTFLDNVCYGQYPNQLMDIAFPDGEVKGAIMLIHGGAWVEGERVNGYTEPLTKVLIENGFIAATMDYRFISKSVNVENILNDIKMGLDCLFEKAEFSKLGISKVMLIGWSAGGHLAELYAYTRAEDARLKVTAVCGYSAIADISVPSLCFNNPLSDIINRDMFGVVSELVGEEICASNFSSSENLLLKYSPINYAKTGVPTLICHSEIDQYVEYNTAKNLQILLKQYNIANDFVDFPRSGHDLGFDPDSMKLSYEKIIEYAEKYVKK